jgi:hypothetical protein
MGEIPNWMNANMEDKWKIRRAASRGIYESRHRRSELAHFA